MTAQEKYNRYKEMGYYVPYNEPYDVEEYLLNSTWVLICKTIAKTLVGTMWITFLVASIGGCYKLYDMCKQQLEYDTLMEKWKAEIKLYEDPLVIKETNEKYKKKI